MFGLMFGPNWPQLLTYRTIDQSKSVVSSDRSVFDDWVELAGRTGKISAAATEMFSEF